MKSIFLSDLDEEAIVEFVKQHEELYDKTVSKTSRRKKNFGRHSQLPGIYLSGLSRSGLRLSVPDMTSLLRRSQDKQLRRAQNDRPG